MQFFFLVSWRNLWRNKRRSIITSMAMAVAISLCMWLLSLNSGFYLKFEEILIDQKMGHIQIQNPSYNKTKALQDSIPSASAVLKKIQDMPQTAAVSARLQATALASSQARSTGALFSGVIPASEKKLTTIHEQLIEGKYISDEANKEVIIGFELQEELKLTTGDELVVFTQGADGSMAYDSLKISGVYKSGSILLDRGAIMHLYDLQTMLSMPDQVHEIIVLSENKEEENLSALSNEILTSLKETDLKVYEYPKLDDFNVDTRVYDPQYGIGVITEKDSQGVATIKFENKERPYSQAQMRALELPDAKIKKSDSNIGVRTWWETDPTIAEMMKMRDIATAILLGLVFFIAGFGILNTMLMSVFERTREIGILKALGLRPRRIVLLIVFESFLLSCVAAFFGLMFGGLLVYLMLTQGLDISGGTGEPIAMLGANIEPTIYGHFDIKEGFLPLISLFFISILASLWPAIRAARLKPVEAIRQE